MATLRERTTKKGARRWQALVRRQGLPDKVATFRTKREAERWAQIEEGDIAAARHLPGLAAERHTVGELIGKYRATLTDKRRIAIGRHLDWWETELGALKLSQLTTARISEARDKLAAKTFVRARPRNQNPLTGAKRRKEAKSYPISASTVNRYVEALRRALSLAETRWQWTTRSPARGLGKLQEPRGRVRILSTDERERLLGACAAASADLHLVVTLALSTGARAGELLALRWADVDLPRRRAILHETKNNDRRALSLAGPALALLRQRATAKPDPESRVIPGRDEKPFDYAGRFRRALKTAKVEGFRFHDLRHSCASYLAMGGATAPELAAILGHKTLAMVKRYSHLTDQHVSSVVERMNEKVFGTPAATP